MDQKNSSEVGKELAGESVSSPRPAPSQGVPDISLQPRHPVLQALASGNSWVRVEFFGKEPPTKVELYRTIELLCMMHNGWS